MTTAESQKTKITYAFVDASNIIYRETDRNAWRIDLYKLIEYLRGRFNIQRVFYYAGVDNRNKAQLGLYKKMEEWGYELRLHPVKNFVNARGEFYQKADVDSRMTFEIMKSLSEYDRAVVLTGDGDFRWVLEYLLEKKETVWLLASPSKTAKELKRLFGYRFSSLDDTRKWLEYFETKTK